MQKRFENIANRFLSTQKEKKRRTDISKFINELKKQFVDRFITNQQELCQKNVDKTITLSYDRIKRIPNVPTGFSSFGKSSILSNIFSFKSG